jgi:hypothetical protein
MSIKIIPLPAPRSPFTNPAATDKIADEISIKTLYGCVLLFIKNQPFGKFV